VSTTEFNYLEKDDVIRFKVEEESFKEATPAPPKAHGSGEIEHRAEEHKEPIYSLIVRTRDASLMVGELSRGRTGSRRMVGRLNWLVHKKMC
jgi:hypothetical protein